MELFRQNSVLNSLECKGVILKKCDTLYEESVRIYEYSLDFRIRDQIISIINA